MTNEVAEAQQEIIDGAGHGLPYTHAEDVLARIRDFHMPVM